MKTQKQIMAEVRANPEYQAAVQWEKDTIAALQKIVAEGHGYQARHGAMLMVLYGPKQVYSWLPDLGRVIQEGFKYVDHDAEAAERVAHQCGPHVPAIRGVVDRLRVALADAESLLPPAP